MPEIVPYIYDIAIEKNRGVLFISFKDLNANEFIRFRYPDHTPRTELIDWLKHQKINFSAAVLDYYNYLGELYIDVPYNPNDPTYKTLSEHLETKDGHPKIEGVYFYYLPLEKALELQKEYENYD
ncbi:hypothetical protein P256_01546 [Acinetobacter nectaris CIP 110549]|uniref:Uncharacterized protein n=1 Tax=Acinetobacter nectaris CIP 110549 TaxID=1392540 RepID=V2TN25_9GAMM|nr:hypothetical protein [Acinetobacter nectaris]ESK38727.1 hypothetical protein P256_01546 [Acinetobacter nectaris CIP 110549]